MRTAEVTEWYSFNRGRCYPKQYFIKKCLTPAFIEFIQKANSGQNIAETLKSGEKNLKLYILGDPEFREFFM